MRLLWTLLFFGIILTSTAQERLSLGDAIQYALNNHLKIQIARKNAMIAQTQDNWAFAGKSPAINLNFTNNNSLTNNDNPASFLNGGFFNGSANFNVDVGLTLFNGYRIQTTKQQLSETALQNKTQLRKTTEDIVFNVIQAYYSAVIQQEQLKLFEESLDLSRERVSRENIRRELAAGSTFEWLQAQDAYINDSTNMVVQKNQYEITLRNLWVAMGQTDTEKAIDLVDSLSADWIEITTTQSDLALQSNIDLQLLDHQKTLAQLNTTIQQSFLKPIVQANAGGNIAGSLFNTSQEINGEKIGTVLGNSRNGYINLTASLPIFDGGVNRKNVGIAEMQEDIALMQMEDTKRVLMSQFANQRDNYLNQQRVYEMTKSLVENANQNLLIAKDRFESAQISSFDYRTVQLSQVSAKVSQLNALFNAKLTELELLRLTGQLVQ